MRLYIYYSTFTRLPSLSNTFFLLAMLAGLLGFTSPAIGQDHFKNFQAYNYDDGLPRSQVTAVVQDKYGFTWLGTTRGLSRFDGVSFKNYFSDPQDSTSLGDDLILEVCTNPINGEIWMGHDRNLISIFSPETETFIQLHPNENNPTAMPNGSIQKMIIDAQGIAWIIFKGHGLWRVDTKNRNFESTTIKKRPNRKLNFTTISGINLQEDTDDKNIIWVGGYRGFLKVDKKNNVGEFLEHQLFDNLNPRFFGIVQLPNNKIYLTGDDGQLYCFDKNDHSFKKISIERNAQGLPIKWRTDVNIHQQDEHTFWMNNYSDIHLFDSRDNKIIQSRTFKRNESFRILYIGNNNDIWAAGRNSQLKIFNPVLPKEIQSIKFSRLDKRPNSNKGEIYFDKKDQILYSTGMHFKGLYTYDLQAEKSQLIPAPDKFLSRSSAVMKASHLFAGEDGQINILAQHRQLTYRPGDDQMEKAELAIIPDDKTIRYRMTASDGTNWSSGIRGLYYQEPQKQMVHSLIHEMEDLSKASVMGGKIVEDKNGNIWSPITKGIFGYLNNQDKLIYHEFDKIDDLDKVVKTGDPLIDQSGNVWVVVDARMLAYIDANHPEKGIVQYYVGPNEANIHSMCHFDNQFLVFTDRGAQLFDPEKKAFETYFLLDENIKNAVVHGVQISDSEVAGLTNEGIIIFQPKQLMAQSGIVKPYLNSLFIGDRNVGLNQIYHDRKRIELSPNQQEFSISFSALGYGQRIAPTFRYKLANHEEWRMAEANDKIFYNKIPAGNYDFIVEPIDSREVPLGPTTLAQIVITPPWWRTNWFLALSSSLILGTLLLIYKLRINRVRKEERLRAQFQKELSEVEMTALRAQMNPHFIFNSLNSIDYYIISQDRDTASDYLNRFSRLIRLVLQNSKSEKVPLQSDLEALRLYIELEQLRFEHKFDFEIKIDPKIDVETTLVPPLLIQPYVENSIWHGLMQRKGVQGKLRILLNRKNEFIICQIEDNGIGRTASRELKSKTGAERKSFGMKITSDRLDLINAKDGGKASVEVIDLQHDDGRAAGTLVDLEIPIQ